jgi:hypothetical protein
VRRLNVVGVMAVVGAAVAMVGAGPAGAAPGEGAVPAVDGWVVENPRADGLYDTFEGSARLVGGSDVAIGCSAADGWGRADNETVPAESFVAGTGVTGYTGCAGTEGPDVQLYSSPDMVFVAEAYDATADRIAGSAYVWTWGLFLVAPDCDLTMYAADSDVAVPFTYDNPTGSFDIGPLVVSVHSADGTGCAGIAQIGDLLTFDTDTVATPALHRPPGLTAAATVVNRRRQRLRPESGGKAGPPSLQRRSDSKGKMPVEWPSFQVTVRPHPPCRPASSMRSGRGLPGSGHDAPSRSRSSRQVAQGQARRSSSRPNRAT